MIHSHVVYNSVSVCKWCTISMYEYVCGYKQVTSVCAYVLGKEKYYMQYNIIVNMYRVYFMNGEYNM